MTAPFLADALGPRGRRNTRIATAVSTLIIAGLIAVAISRLADKGQLDAAKWEPFTQWAVWRFLLRGLRTTVEAALAAMGGAMVIGALMALARLSRTRALRWLATFYVEFFRGVPLVLLIFFAAFGLPRYGLRWSLFAYLVLGLTIYNGAVLGEIFRAGILSLDRGQTEAAYSIGLGYWPTMLLVVIPQAARRMIPAIVSQLVTLLKDTSLGSAIALEEVLRRGRINGEFFQNPLQSLFVVASIYIVVNFTLSRIARRLEVRQRRRYGAGEIAVGGIEDLAVLQATDPLAPQNVAAVSN
ncbi:MAG: amino acid ABC transporter permease [Acidimicrobiales bacterium]